MRGNAAAPRITDPIPHHTPDLTCLSVHLEYLAECLCNYQRFRELDYQRYRKTLRLRLVFLFVSFFKDENVNAGN